MPFTSDFDDVFERFIKLSLSEAGFDVFRAKDIMSQQSILRDIVESLRNSDIVVADLTSSNPNVYYELGIAHGCSRPVILLTQEIDDIPFDLRPYRVVQYSTHFARIGEARQQLTELARAALSGKVLFGNPVSDLDGSPPRITVRDGTASEVIELRFESQGRNEAEEQDDALPNDGDAGFIDNLLAVLEGMEKMGQIISQIGEQHGSMTHATDIMNTELVKAGENPDVSNLRHMRKVAQSFARKLDDYADLLTQQNKDYRQALAGASEAMEYLVRNQSVEDDDQRERLSQYLRGLEETERQVAGAREAFSGLATSIRTTASIEKQFNRARMRAADSLDAFVQSIDQTASMITRARRIGEELLGQDGQELA